MFALMCKIQYYTYTLRFTLGDDGCLVLLDTSQCRFICTSKNIEHHFFFCGNSAPTRQFNVSWWHMFGNRLDMIISNLNMFQECVVHVDTYNLSSLFFCIYYDADFKDESEFNYFERVRIRIELSLIRLPRTEYIFLFFCDGFTFARELYAVFMFSQM